MNSWAEMLEFELSSAFCANAMLLAAHNSSAGRIADIFIFVPCFA
jgi:hypothetical protein